MLSRKPLREVTVSPGIKLESYYFLYIEKYNCYAKEDCLINMSRDS